MYRLTPLRRPPRPGEWTAAKVVTFIVTLAAHRSVTLAGRAAGTSRKSAYALKARDKAFAAVWRTALAARATARQGNEVEEVDTPPGQLGQGDRPIRDRFFARLAAQRPNSAPLARAAPAQ